MSEISSIIPKRYDGIDLYDPKRQPVTHDLSNSTSQWGMAPEVHARIAEVVANDDISLYPDIYAAELKKVIADYYSDYIDGVDNVEVGNGSDDVLDCVIRTVLSEGDRVVVHTPTFPMAQYFARVNDRDVRPSALLKDGSVNVDEIISLNPQLVYVCTPNNPTAMNVPRGGIDDLLSRYSGFVIIDEAYGEFSETHCLDLLRKYNNVIITRTMSKLHAFAGLRIGYALGDPQVIAAIHATRGPFKANTLGIEASKVSFTCKEWHDNVISEMREVRSWFIAELESLGFKVRGRDANFVYIEGIEEEKYKDIFIDNGYLVRWFPHLELVGAGARVSVSPREILEPFLALIKDNQ